MKYVSLFLFTILLLGSSCRNGGRTKATEEVIDSLVINSNRITNSLGETLISKAKRELRDWKEYNDVDEFIINYYNISISEALSNAEELSNLVKLMKDTIRIPKLETPNVIARFNVLHNETLRLADMASINSISDEEVEEEVTQILDVYSAVNSKINTIYKAESLQNSLEVDTEVPVEPEDKIQSMADKIKASRKKKN